MIRPGDAHRMGPLAAPLHQRIERFARETPGKTALRHRDRELTYDVLNRRANQLARELRARGIGAEQRVAVLVEPSIDAVVALLAILKAGAAYVPIDPTYPTERVAAMLEDPALILSRDELIARLPSSAQDRTFSLDGAPHVPDGRSDEDLSTPIALDQTAYVMYTSGTTGKPKGVMASHANLLHYIGVAREKYRFCSADVMPAIARFTFSISIFELLSPLAAGGTLWVLDRDHVLDLARMADTLTRVTAFHAGPSLLKRLVSYIQRQHPSPEAFAAIRHASSGGDMVPPELLEAMKAVFPRAELYVIYGCSEISCMGCTYPVPRDRRVTRSHVGKPFPGMAMRLLEADGKPVRAGSVGEIYFAGAGVTRGYLHRDELTAERFFDLEGVRFYRTGDLGRLDEAGDLEILGRTDFQIKLNGVRIESGEVEYALRAAPGVQDAVVSARPGPGGDKALVAYVVLDGEAARAQGSDALISAIRRHVSTLLPDYMAPSIYVELASLPLNHNMKVDRNALPDPEFGSVPRSSGCAAGARAPLTATERQLSALWEEILGVRPVGLDDVFFELGGDSGRALELILKVQEKLGVTLTGMEILRETLEVLAGTCDQQRGEMDGAPAARPPVPLISPGLGEVCEAFYFGRDRALFGTYRAPERIPQRIPERTVLICGPVGQEQVRTNFVLRKLARRLARAGMGVLTFHYYGCDDSQGHSVDARIGRWQQDVLDASRELRRRAPGARISALGVRLGAALLGTVVPEWAPRPGTDLARLVFWDPIWDGSAYLSRLTALHHRLARGTAHLRLGRRPRPPGRGVELMGMTYSEACLGDLRRLMVRSLGDAPVPVRWVATTPSSDQEAAFRRICDRHPDARFLPVSPGCQWEHLAHLGEILPDVGLVETLAALLEGR